MQRLQEIYGSSQISSHDRFEGGEDTVAGPSGLHNSYSNALLRKRSLPVLKETQSAALLPLIRQEVKKSGREDARKVQPIRQPYIRKLALKQLRRLESNRGPSVIGAAMNVYEHPLP